MSTTTNLGLFKHDNPATNTEQFDVDKALNQNWDKIDNGIGKDRDRISLLEASNTIYNFKGTVDTLTNLQSKTKTQGDVWYCEENSTYYTYTGTDWIPVNLNLNLDVIDELKEKTIKCLQEVETPMPKNGTSIDLSDSTDAKVTELKISGNSKQKTSEEGDNWLDTSLLVDETKDGITLTKQNDGSILLNGTATKSLSFLTSLKRTIKNTNSTHALIIGKISGTISESSLYTYLSNSDNTKTTGTPSLNSNNSVASTNLSSDVEYTKMIIGINGGTVLDNVKIFVEVCTSGTNTYIPFKPNSPSPNYPSERKSCGDSGSINEVICNKNMANELVGGTFTDGVPNTDSSTIRIRNTEYIKVKSNTDYTISAKYSKTLQVMIMLYDKNKNFITSSSYYNIWKNINFTFKTTADTVYVMFVFRDSASSNITVSDITEVQLEENSTATDYIEHQSQSYTIPTQQPFRSVEDIRDTFIKKNNKWYERHYIARKIFDGTEEWGIEKTNGFYRCGLAISNIKTTSSANEIGKIQCSHFKAFSANSSYIGENNGIAINDTPKIFIVNISNNIDTLEKLKTWLTAQYNTGTAVYIDYVLVEPVDIECTEEQSTVLWDIEQNAKTYKNITHIYSTDNVSPKAEITYKKDIETLFNNILVS